MRNKGCEGRLTKMAYPVNDFSVIGMGGNAVQLGDFRVDRHHFAVNFDFFFALQYTVAARAAA